MDKPNRRPHNRHPAIRTLDAMQVALVTAPELGSTIARLYRSHKFLCAIQNPVSGKVAVYASDSAAVDALIEARSDFPKGVPYGEWERLSNEAIAALKATRMDPASAALKHLGQIDPTAATFERPTLIL